MSRLNLRLRPFAVFDPANKKHREDYARFLETGSWSHCKVRYEMDEPVGELQAMIQRRLLEYYVSKEFTVEFKKPDWF